MEIQFASTFAFRSAFRLHACQDQSPTFGSFILGQYLQNMKCFTRSWWTYESLLRTHVFPLLEAQPLGQIAVTGITAIGYAECGLREIARSGM